MNQLHDLAEIGQSIWLDYIRRAFLLSGELQDWIDKGLRGVTSNPIIFDKAISGSTDYDDGIHHLVDEGQPVFEIYETLAKEDIRNAADILLPVYEATDGLDGYVSLEVRPVLANDTQGTIEEARRLFSDIARPNVMIKVPATHAGFPAIETLIGEGININVTLIFSLAHYEKVAEAYLAGLERYAQSEGDVGKVASVASFFVSRVDGAVDRILEERGERDLLGKIAIANTKVAHKRAMELFSGERWQALAGQGARVQRLLWASTSTKNPHFPDTMYVDELIGRETVNTVPPATLRAFLDHGKIEKALEAGVEEAQEQLVRLEDLGIDLNAITQKLQDDGVEAFAKAFDGLLNSIESKREQLRSGWRHMDTSLGKYETDVKLALEDVSKQKILTRIWEHDHTVWKDNPSEITNRLGWLQSPEFMMDNLDRLDALQRHVREAGYTHAVLLGMGGSSLAPEVFRKTFGVKKGFLDLTIMYSTDPGAVLTVRETLDLSKTLFIVATKSGSTVETLSFFKYFYNEVAVVVGEGKTGEHFIAITDPGSKLEALAERYHFRATFLNDPNIGGRYSALSYFGLVPAALLGVDLELLLDRALAASCGSESCVQAQDNPGLRLGVILGELVKQGRDKVTIITSPAIASFGDWVEQLIAESTGKERKGILPVVGEPVGEPEVYGHDRIFIHIGVDNDDIDEAAIKKLEEADHPIVWFRLRDPYDLGGQFFLWELATAVTSQRLGINPFDQPNVESAKVLATEKVSAYMSSGVLPLEEPVLSDEGMEIFVSPNGSEEMKNALAKKDPNAVLRAFLNSGELDAYVTLQAYLRPTPEVDEALLHLRSGIRERTKFATTSGYGPRFLHSTGQLHKGDAGRGLFLQITADDPEDVPIPDDVGSSQSSITFGVLKAAQAQGDRQALMDAGRKVLRIHLGGNVMKGLGKLVHWV